MDRNKGKTCTKGGKWSFTSRHADKRKIFGAMNYTDQFFQIRVFKFFTSATELRFKVLKIKSHKMHNVDGK